MNKLIVAIIYNDDGTRSISRLFLNLNYNYSNLKAYTDAIKEMYDEVYIIDFDTNDTDLINYIVNKGCRL